MKLLSFFADGHETWGMLIGDGVADLGRRTRYASLVDFLNSGEPFSSLAALPDLAADVPLDKIEYLPVIPRPEKVICTGGNYHKHRDEVMRAGDEELRARLASQDPKFPPIFLRTWRSNLAHNAPIQRPIVSKQLDWEGELAVVIGKAGRNISLDNALAHVAGYTCYNDVSVRDFQFHAKTVAAGKNFEATGGLGPWMTTAEELDPKVGLHIQVRLNGEIVQDSTTDLMIHDIPKLISYCSSITTLVPGDIIAMGTMEGTGWTREPPLFMQAGDICEVEIEGIGVLRNPVVDQAPVSP